LKPVVARVRLPGAEVLEKFDKPRTREAAE